MHSLKFKENSIRLLAIVGAAAIALLLLGAMASLFAQQRHLWSSDPFAGVPGRYVIKNGYYTFQHEKPIFAPQLIETPGLVLDNQKVKFKVTAADWAALGCSLVSGIGGGANNAFHADGYVFENMGWKGKYWRHNGWENNYPGGQYDEGESPIKPEFLNGFRDVFHGSEDLEVVGLTFSIGLVGLSEGHRVAKGKAKWRHTAIKLLALQIVRIGAKNVTYNALRYGKIF